MRQEGIDLLPGVTNTQILSRLELGLLRHDSKIPENLPKRFSRRLGDNSNGGEGLLHDLRHFLKFVGGVLKTAKDDPSLVQETMRYKGE